MISILVSLQPAARVKIVELPGLPAKGDIYDWLEDHDGSEPDSLQATIERLVDDIWFVDASEGIGGPILQCLANVQPAAIKWLWPRRIPLGRITLLVGRPGEGKSFLTTYMAGIDQAQLSRLMGGKKGVSVENLERLAEALGLEIVIRPKTIEGKAEKRKAEHGKRNQRPERP